MQIKQKKVMTPKTIVLIIGGLVLIGVAGYYGYSYLMAQRSTTASEQRPVNSVDYSEPTPEDKAISDQQKNDIISKNEDRDGQSVEQTELNLTINRVSQTPDNRINVRSQLSGAYSGTGTCSALFTKGTASLTKTFALSPGTSFATCNGDVPIDEFSSAGGWQLKLTASTDSGSASATRDFEVQK